MIIEEMNDVIYIITAYVDGDKYEFKTGSARIAEAIANVLCRMDIRCSLYGEVKQEDSTWV